MASGFPKTGTAVSPLLWQYTVVALVSAASAQLVDVIVAAVVDVAVSAALVVVVLAAVVVPSRILLMATLPVSQYPSLV